jgi:uncharacterized protein YutE (UPF0331/DUF86 family)
MDDVVVNKLATIERCLKRIKQVYAEVEGTFQQDFTRQDSIILNLQRACEASIDLANYVNKTRKLGVPQSSRDSFNLLVKSELLPAELADNLMKMVGLRNIAVHDYQELNLDIVVHVIEHHLTDFVSFSDAIKKLTLSQ